jgi:hypothetical protein
MTKFQELQEACRQRQLKAEGYRREAYAFGSSFVQELRRLLECSDDDAYLFPIVEKYDANKHYSAAGAMQIGADGFWQFAVAIRIQPLNEVFLRIHLWRFADSWVFKFGPDGREKRIALPDPTAAQTLADASFDFVYDNLKSDFLQRPKPHRV